MQIGGRSLRVLIDEVAKSKENRRSAGSGNLEHGKAKEGTEEGGVLGSKDVNTVSTKGTEDKK